jgi:hypothetical protein
MAKIQGFFGKLATSDGTEVSTGLLTADTKYAVKTLGTELDNCDISKFSLEFTDPELNVSGLCDKTNVYLTGRTDVSSSIEGFFSQSVTDRDGGLLNNFVDIVRQAGPGGAVTIDKVDKTSYYVFLYKQKETNAGDIEQFYVFSGVTVTFSDEVDGETAQGFSGTIRPTDDAVNGVKFQLVNVTHS